jgi:MoaA/NifB/PqqE/SkfB family radical SAM enzyme
LIEKVRLDKTKYPKILEFHLGRSCPCACIFCCSKDEHRLLSDLASYRHGPNATLLSSDEVLSIVNRVVDDGCEAVYFSGGQEPFASRTTVDVLYRLPEVSTSIFTSGVPNTLSDEVLKFLVQRTDRIRFSINAATAHTYSIVQMPHRPDGEATFWLVVNRVKKAVMYRNERRNTGKSAARVGVSFVAVPRNYTEIEDAVNMWAEIGIDRFDIGNDVLGEDSQTEVMTEDHKRELNGILDRVMEKDISDELKGMRVRTIREPVHATIHVNQKCYTPLEKVIIDSYGNVWAYCTRSRPSKQSGNLYLGSIRNGEDLQKLLSYRYNQSPAFSSEPLSFSCRECTDYEYMANTWIQKLIDDREFGIALDDQPFNMDQY